MSGEYSGRAAKMSVTPSHPDVAMASGYTMTRSRSSSNIGSLQNSRQNSVRGVSSNNNNNNNNASGIQQRITVDIVTKYFMEQLQNDPQNDPQNDASTAESSVSLASFNGPSPSNPFATLSSVAEASQDDSVQMQNAVAQNIMKNMQRQQVQMQDQIRRLSSTGSTSPFPQSKLPNLV